MRNFLLFLAFIPSVTFGQKFTATPDGLRDSLNLDRSFLVIYFEGKSVEELYDLTYKFVQTHYSNPKNALRGNVDNDYLKIGTYAENVLLMQKGIIGERYFGDIHFTAEFSVRDGRVKFEPTQITLYDWENDIFPYKSSGGLYWSIYKKNGKPLKDLNIQFENYFNTYVSDYIKFVNSDGNGSDEW